MIKNVVSDSLRENNWPNIGISIIKHENKQWTQINCDKHKEPYKSNKSLFDFNLFMGKPFSFPIAFVSITAIHSLQYFPLIKVENKRWVF